MAALAAALAAWTGAPASAAGPYDIVEESSGGMAGPAGGSWAADADAAADGAFSLTASVDEPGLSADFQHGQGQAAVKIGSSFSLTAGTYTAAVSYRGLSVTASSSPLAQAEAVFGMFVECNAPCSLTTGNGSLTARSVGPVPVSLSGVDHTVSLTLTLDADATVEVAAFAYGVAWPKVNDPESSPVHGGSSSVAASGTVDAVTVAPV